MKTKAAAEGVTGEIAEDVTTEDQQQAADDSQVADDGGEGESSAASNDDTADDGETQAAATGETSDESELVVTIGEESPTSEEDEGRAPEWVRELRKTNRELARKNRELEDRLKTAAPAASATVVGEKPTLESCEFDSDKFEAELLAWNERKRRAESEAEQRRKAEQDAEAAWQARQQEYRTARADLSAKVRDFEDAEEAVKATFDVTQQGVILHGAEKPEVLVYALGKNPKVAKDLAAIKDPVKFAFAVAKLETKLKVTPKKAAPLPEKTVRAGGTTSGAVDSELNRLRAEAEKTGDYSKVAAWKRQQAKKAA